MRKDINIPEVTDVYVAAVKEFNETHRTNDWNAYLINDSDAPLEMVLIVSNGYNDSKITSQMRHKLQLLPAKSFAKIEFIEDSVLALNNEFAVTYFLDGKLYDKKFIFPSKSIQDANVAKVPVMVKEGVLAQ